MGPPTWNQSLSLPQHPLLPLDSPCSLTARCLSPPSLGCELLQGQPPLGLAHSEHLKRWQNDKEQANSHSLSPMGAVLPSRVPLTFWGCEGVGKGCTHPHPGSAEARTGCLIHSGTSPRSVGRQVCRWV